LVSGLAMQASTRVSGWWMSRPVDDPRASGADHADDSVIDRVVVHGRHATAGRGGAETPRGGELLRPHFVEAGHRTGGFPAASAEVPSQGVHVHVVDVVDAHRAPALGGPAE